MPPASVDFVSTVWNNFHEALLPKLGLDAREAVLGNRDPKEMGNIKAHKVQEDILECIYSKFFFFSKIHLQVQLI